MTAARRIFVQPLRAKGFAFLLSSIALLVFTTPGALAIRSGNSHSNKDTGAQGGFICPDGWECQPAPCEIENSNGKPGLECACKGGFAGEIRWSGSIASGSCTPAPCTVPNSNEMPGAECACKDGFVGNIMWMGANHQGTCEPAPCDVENSNGLPGPECECDEFSIGFVRWSGSKPMGHCKERVVNAIGLFDADSLMTLNGKTVKCCVSSQAGVSPKIQDLAVEQLPAARTYGQRWGCGRMFGDTWHSARHRKGGGKCKIKLSILAEYFKVPRERLVEDLQAANLETEMSSSSASLWLRDQFKKIGV